MADLWQPIETAPSLERIWICGWQKPSHYTGGYWWWRESMAENGRAIDAEGNDECALYWCPIVLPPFPAPPELKGE